MKKKEKVSKWFFAWCSFGNFGFILCMILVNFGWNNLIMNILRLNLTKYQFNSLERIFSYSEFIMYFIAFLIFGNFGLCLELIKRRKNMGLERKKLWLIWIIFGISGFGIGEVFSWLGWWWLYDLFYRSMNVKQITDMKEIFNYHYLISFFLLILFGTLGLILEMIKEEFKNNKNNKNKNH